MKTDRSDQDRSEPLPFPVLLPLVGGVLVGIALRLVFSGGGPRAPFATMTVSFIFLAPIVVGAVTVYLGERIRRRSWAYYIGASFFANALFVVGTLLIMIEGWICAILILPLFSLLGVFGGLLMGIVCRITKWPKHAVYSIAVLPFILGALEPNVPLPERIRTVERTIAIGATPEAVWQQIHNARDIQVAEVDHAWALRIGVPLPLSGVTQQTPTGLVRKMTMGKNIHFDQVVAEWQENRYVRWTYRFYEDSFPPNALDDHVRIGGYYFDLKDTSYTLTPHGNNTELKLRMQYRVSTHFNWYADPIANTLVGDLEETILALYRYRCEAKQ